MKLKIFKSVISVCLAAALVILPASVSFAAAGSTNPSAASNAEVDAAVKNKEEVIYATLGSNGGVHAVYAINHFNIMQAGKVTDYGNYSSVENLTGTDVLINNGGSVSFQAGEGNFYYQGDMAVADLPWIFELSYYLDGVKMAPQDLAGKTGNLEIRIATRPNEKSNRTFYENYMLQLSVTLDTEKCGNINAPGATIASPVMELCDTVIEVADAACK